MKTVLITGAGGNLGLACANHFAEKDWQVLAFVSPGKKPANSNSRIRYVEADLLNEANTGQVIEELTREYSVIDLAILTVGGFEAGGIEKTDNTALRRMYSLNFETAYHVVRPLFGMMNKQASGGRIVFIGARPALDAAAGKGLVAYGLSKSLLFRLADYLNATSDTVRSHVIVFTALNIVDPILRTAS